MLYDEIFLTNNAIPTSTRDALWNSSSGAEICTTVGCDGTSTPAAPYIATGTLGQFLSDASTTLGAGSSTTDNVVVFKGTPMSSSSGQLKLQIEIEPSSTAFVNASSVTSAIVSSGNVASVSSTNLANGSYHWQARVLDNETGATSTWTRFGANATGTDFVVNAPQRVEI